MKNLTIVVIALCLSLSACSYRETTETKKTEVSGCEIFQIELKGQHHPIFLAKCKDTATVSYNTGGKNNHRGVTVTVMEKESADLEERKAELDKKRAALSKLSDEEKKLLGLQ